MMKKRLLSILLCCCMMLTLLMGMLTEQASALTGTMLKDRSSANLFYPCSKPSAEEASDNYYLFLFDVSGNPVIAGEFLRFEREYQRSSNEGDRGDCILMGNGNNFGIRLEPVTDKGQTYFYIKRYDDTYYKRCTEYLEGNYLDYVKDRKKATQWRIDEKDGAYIIKEKGENKYWNYDKLRENLSVTDYKSRALKFTIYKRENPTYVFSFSALYGEVAGKPFLKQKDFSSLADYTSKEYINGVFNPIKITLPCEAMKGFKFGLIRFFHTRVTLGNDPGVIKRDPSMYLSRDPDIVTLVANSKEGISGRIEQTKINVEVYYEGHVTRSGIPIDGSQEIPDSDYTVTDPGSCVKHRTRYLECKNCGLPVLWDSYSYGEHDWAEPEYKWNDDHSACTATRKCKINSSHTETASATVSQKTTQPTCTSNGECRYTATFEEKWADTQIYTEKNADSKGHTYGDWTEDGETGHYRVCTAENCPDADKGRQNRTHDFDDEADTTCNTCGYTRSITPVHVHRWAAEWTEDSSCHWHECTAEGCDITDNAQKDGYAAHSGGTATCTEKAVCTDCGSEYGTLAAHSFTVEAAEEQYLKSAATCTSKATYYYSCACGAKGTEAFESGRVNADKHTGTIGDWQKDSESHWKEYSCCRAQKDMASHEFGVDNICDVCGYDKTVMHTHALTLVPEKPATCTMPGNTAYYTCDGCDKWFADAEGTSEITDKSSVVIKANGHTTSDWKFDDTQHWKECTATGCSYKAQAGEHSFKWIVDKAATADEKGSRHEECTTCGYKKDAVDIPATGSETQPTDPAGSADTAGQTTSAETRSGNDVSSNSAKTGDNSDIFMWIALLLASGGAVIGTTAYSRKKKENAE